MTGMRLTVTVPSDASTTGPDSPRRRATTAWWARSLILTHSSANRSLETNPSTRSYMKSRRAEVSGVARIWPRSGRADSNSASGSISFIISSVMTVAMAACTAGSSMAGPTRSTQTSVSSRLRLAQNARLATRNERQLRTTRAPTARRRVRPPWTRRSSDAASAARRSRSALSSSTSAARLSRSDGDPPDGSSAVTGSVVPSPGSLMAQPHHTGAPLAVTLTG